jgi:hypothetical protein
MIAREFTSELPRDSNDCEFIHKHERSQRGGFASNERASSGAGHRGGRRFGRVFFWPR